MWKIINYTMPFLLTRIKESLLSFQFAEEKRSTKLILAITFTGAL